MSPRTVTIASPSEGVMADSNDVAMAASLLGGESAGSEATGSAAISDGRGTMLRPGRLAGLLATSERSDGTPLDGHGLPDLAVGRLDRGHG
jgi:hypothetical protein